MQVIPQQACNQKEVMRVGMSSLWESKHANDQL